jgi:glycosyltransferase involved in cell wall biosynthesis
MKNEKVIGYVLKGFGRTSETFISNEIELLERTGVKIRIFSLKELTGQLAHGVTQRITAPVTFLPEVTPAGGRSLAAWLGENWRRFAGAHRRLMVQRPWAWLTTLASVLIHAPRGLEARRTAIREFLQAGFIAAEVVGESEGEIVHLHAHFAHTATTVTMLAARLAGRTFSFTAHAKDIYRVDMNPGDLLARKLRAASFAVTCTRANVDYLAGFTDSPEKIHRIYHGIDLDLFKPPAERVSAAPPLILAVGRFVEKKGFPDLIEACRMLRDDGVRFRAMIVGGTTELTAEVQSRIDRDGLGEIVTLHPALTQERLREIYAEATLFALPCLITADGDRDGIPNVLVEALAEGLPVISTNVSGIPELIRDGETGLLVEPQDPVALAGAIRRLLADPELGRRLGRTGSEFVHHEFDARRNIAALRRLFDQTTGSRTR